MFIWHDQYLTEELCQSDFVNNTINTGQCPNIYEQISFKHSIVIGITKLLFHISCSDADFSLRSKGYEKIRVCAIIVL